MKKLAMFLVLLGCAAMAGCGSAEADVVESGVDDSGESQSAGEPESTGPTLPTVAAGTVSFDALGGITASIPRDAEVVEGNQCVLLQFLDGEDFLAGVLVAHIVQDWNGLPIADAEAYFDLNPNGISYEATDRTAEAFGTTLLEYATEEIGPIANGMSCAPIGSPLTGDPTVGYFGIGREYVADAPGGGVYIIGVAAIDESRKAEYGQVVDQIVETLVTPFD